MKRLLAATTAVALAVPAAARAQVPDLCGPVNRLAPFAFVRVGPVCLNLSNSIVPVAGAGGLFSLALQNLPITQDGVGRIGLVNSLNVTFKQDPYIDFGVNTANVLFNPASYAFYFGTPIDPGMYRVAQSTGGVNVTTGLLSPGTVAQDGGARFITVYGSDGATLIPMGVNIGTGTCNSGATSNSCLYPQPSGGPRTNVFNSTFLDNIEVELVYAQGGEISTADWNGRAEVFLASTVPEPSTVALVAAGGALLVGGARRRRR